MSKQIYRGSQFPDAVKPMTYSIGSEGYSVTQSLNRQPLPQADQFGSVPITTPFASQYLQRNDFEPLVKVIENVLETIDQGWEFHAAKPRRMAYNQVVDIIRFPRRPMPMVPEDVPAPVITHEREQFRVQMDEYKLQFEMEGKYLVFGGEEANMVQINFVYSLISSMNISWKQKIKFTFLNAPQNHWQDRYKIPGARALKDINRFELQNFARLDRDDKGFPNMITYVRQLSKMEQFDFNTIVLPFGKLDEIAARPYFTEYFRSGNGAIKTLFSGGKRLAGMVEGMSVFEDSREFFKSSRVIDEDAFVEQVTHGGFISNQGHVDCDDDDDPNCKYGFQYIRKGQKNWETKTLTDLIRENARYGADGKQDPFLYTLCKDWESFSRVSGIYVKAGRLDPMAYKISDDLVTNDKVLTTYTPAVRFGEQDPAYSPLHVVRRHARRIHHLVKKHMSPIELEALLTMDNYRKKFRDITEVNEVHEAFLAAVTIANTADTYAYNNHHFVLDTSNISLFLNRNPFNMAPNQTPRIVDLPVGAAAIFPRFIPAGQTKALAIIINGKMHYIFTVKYDQESNLAPYGNPAVAGGRNRGPAGGSFGYVAIPSDARFIQDAIWTLEITNRGAPNADSPTLWDDVFQTSTDAINTRIGAQTQGIAVEPTAIHPVFPEVFEQHADIGAAGAQDFRWVFRPTSNVTMAIDQIRGTLANAARPLANIAAGAAPQGTVNGFVDPLRNPPRQGFTLSLSPVPTMPYFYSRINGLRTLATLETQPDRFGWDVQMIKSIADGVRALDTLFGLMLTVYTKKNLYFNPAYVPFDIQTGDTETDMMNAAISHLWCDADPPFLVRRPILLKSAAGNWMFPRNFIDWNGGVRGVSFRETLAMLNNRFNTGGTYTDAQMINAITGWVGATDPEKATFAVTQVVTLLLDSGLFSGRVKEVILNQRKWDQFALAYSNSTASQTYANYLDQYRANEVVGLNLVAKRALSKFMNTQVLPHIVAAANALTQYFNTVVGAQPPTAATIDTMSREMYTAGYIWLSVVTLWLDDNNMEYSIGYNWVTERRAQTAEPLSMISSTSGKNDVQIIADILRSTLAGLARVTAVAAHTHSQGTVIRHWVNSGLSVTPSLWRRFDTELNSSITALQNAVAAPATEAAWVRLYHTYCLPMRPMKGGDQGEPILGDALYETARSVGGAGAPGRIATHIAETKANLSQAMVKKGNIGLQRSAPAEPSFLQTQRMYSNRADVEAMAKGLSGSVYEDRSKRHVPTEFLTTPQYDAFGRQTRGYTAPVTLQTATNLVIDVSQEPQFMKWRLASIDEEYKANPIEKMAGHLWCMSPFDLNVITNMIEKKITPAGVGHIWFRPFQKQWMGRVLFTEANPKVAESGYNYVFSQGASNMQTDKVNVLLSAMLGCVIYDPRKVLWLKAMTMHGNVSGMGGEAYMSGDFEPTQVHMGKRDGFVVYVGDNLTSEKMKDCISITSKYNIERYTPLVNDRAVLETDEQHVPGLLYTVSKFELYKLNSMLFNYSDSFWNDRNSLTTNVECYDEDRRYWNSATKSFSDHVIGNWHFSGLTPLDSDFLDGTRGVGVTKQTMGTMKY